MTDVDRPKAPNAAAIEAIIAPFVPALAPDPLPALRVAVAESIYQRHVAGWHAVMHEIIEPPCWNHPDVAYTEELTPEQVAWMRGQPLPTDPTEGRLL